MNINHPNTVKRIVIKGYKSIKELDLELRPINILIGANGSGKSNFLSFFELLHNLYEQTLQGHIALNGIDTFQHKGPKTTKSIISRLSFELNEYEFELERGYAGFIFTREELYQLDKKEPIVFSSFRHESNLKNLNSNEHNDLTKYLTSVKKFHFHDTGRASPFFKESSTVSDIFFLFQDGSYIASLLYDIRKKSSQNYLMIQKVIQSVAPFFNDFYLEPFYETRLKLLWSSRFDDRVYTANELSDGTIRFIALTTLFLQPNLPETIIIDEPELGLHPFAIHKLQGLIKSAAARGCQVILATQSTDLISHFEPEDIIAVDLVEGESKFTRLDSKKLKPWLEEYTIDDLWKRSIINLGHPNY